MQRRKRSLTLVFSRGREAKVIGNPDFQIVLFSKIDEGNERHEREPWLIVRVETFDSLYLQRRRRIDSMEERVSESDSSFLAFDKKDQESSRSWNISWRNGRMKAQKLALTKSMRSYNIKQPLYSAREKRRHSGGVYDIVNAKHRFWRWKKSWSFHGLSFSTSSRVSVAHRIQSVIGKWTAHLSAHRYLCVQLTITMDRRTLEKTISEKLSTRQKKSSCCNEIKVCSSIWGKKKKK